MTMYQTRQNMSHYFDNFVERDKSHINIEMLQIFMLQIFIKCILTTIHL